MVATGLDALVEPWFLGSLNEDDVQGYAGTPLNVNGLTFEYLFDNESAAVDFPHEGRYFVALDSRADPYTDQPLRGEYLLHSWQNDVTPPRFTVLSKVVTPGRPLIAGIVSDHGSGVDPLSLVLAYKQTLLLAALYDPGSGLVLWALDGAPKIGGGKTPMLAIASDYQESKNLDQAGERPAQLGLPQLPAAGRDAADRDLAAAAPARVRRRRAVRAGGRLPRRALGQVLRRQASDRDQEARQRGALHDAVAHPQGTRRPPRPACARDRSPRGDRLGHPGRPRVPLAVVTGGSSGIGAAVARALRGRGWECVLVARREERLRPLAEELGAEWELCDVGDREAVERTAAAIVERHPRVSLLVNNAGVPGRGGYLQASPERIEEVTRTNYLGGVWCLRAFLPALEAAAPSDVVNVVSVAGTVAAGSAGPYTASKHAQLAFSRSVSAELRPRGIRVHTILPGFVETEGFPQRERFGPRVSSLVAEPELVAERLLDAVEQNRREVFVPRWYRIAPLAQALAPGLVARLAARGIRPAGD